MLYGDLTKLAVIESVLRLRDELRKKTNADVARVRQLLDNTNPPILPDDMSYDLQNEYRAEWIGLGLASVVVGKLQSAMYGRTITYVIEGFEDNEIIDGIIDRWRRSAPGVYNHALAHGNVVVRFFPDYRKGIVHGIYDPDEVTPIFDPETEDNDAIGLIYHYGVPASSVPFPIPSNIKEVRIVEHITVNTRDRLTGEITVQGTRRRWYSFDNSKWTAWPYYEGDNGLNPYGDHLGAVVWRNDDSFGPWGRSDILPVSDLLQSISTTCTDLKVLLKWNVFPTTYSTAPGFADLPYGWNQSYELQTDGSGNSPTVGQITMDSASLESGMRLLRLLLQMMHETTSVPAIAMGDLEGLGNLSSGRALEVVMLPLSDLTLRRQKLQTYQEEQAVREMLVVLAHAKAPSNEYKIMTERVDGITYPLAYDLKISVEFGQLGLSASSEDTVSYYSGLYAAQLMSLYESVSGLHPDWDDKQILDEMGKIKASTDSREGTVVDDERAARIQKLIESPE